ncbi:hypothetical protein GL218_06862 [Daldinia childiae]|uniref:uncharacterized protein n=1 Tax=Daldinia childiae TaxID=326645 RepID=UPI0014483CFF|nr:uncharacterized protein GL218_06862 [Daldinia childiae]KAF3055777.1 hypothetical protein GL218_06862 [Daldinia childiae]
MRIPPSKAGELRNDGRGHSTYEASDNDNLKVELDQLSVQTRRYIDVTSGLTQNVANLTTTLQETQDALASIKTELSSLKLENEQLRGELSALRLEKNTRSIPPKIENLPLMKLPPDVRKKIWHLAAGPKSMEIFEIRWRSPVPDSEPRSIVTMDKRRMRVSHACQESRNLLYPSSRCTEWPHTPVQTYMDPDRDSVMINGNFMIGMSFEDILGHVQRLILTPDHGSFQIIEEIASSYGPCWNMRQVSFVLETWSISAQASALICKRLSAPLAMASEELVSLLRLEICTAIALRKFIPASQPLKVKFYVNINPAIDQATKQATPKVSTSRLDAGLRLQSNRLRVLEDLDPALR